jgi:5-methylcytosine-specific restriction endonuclease McrA
MSLKNNPEALNAIGFAERVITLLDEGSYNTTYKFAVLLGLMDLVIEKSKKDGSLADMVTTRELAEKVIEIYWNQVAVYSGISAEPLQGKSGQAEIVTQIKRFRERNSFSTLTKSIRDDKNRYKALLNLVEKKLIEMPLPRVQYFGNQEIRFIYDIAWSMSSPINLREVTAQQQQKESSFDNRIHLLPNVADYLVNLNGLLRPFVQRCWAMQVAKINKLEESRLEKFLFGAERAGAARLASDLRQFQNNKCFYCGKPFGAAGKVPEVDHFVPWSRFPNDGLANYVLAHSACNGSKSDHVAGVDHFAEWMRRNHSNAELTDLQQIANQHNWDLKNQESVNIAKALYMRLQPEVELWEDVERYKQVDLDEIRKVVGVYA